VGKQHYQKTVFRKNLKWAYLFKVTLPLSLEKDSIPSVLVMISSTGFSEIALAFVISVTALLGISAGT